MIEFTWFQPATEAFCLGGALSAAFLCFWRALFRKEAYTFRVGLAFWSASLLNFAYLITFKESPRGFNFNTYFFYLLYLVLLLPSLYGRTTKKPLLISEARLGAAVGGVSLICLLLIWGTVSFQHRLPLLSLESRYEPVSRVMPYAFFFLYLAGVLLQWKRWRKTQEPLAAYVLGFLVASLWIFPGIILSRAPYDIPWYSYHLMRCFGYVVIYVALLLEYFDLHEQSEKQTEVQRLLKELSQDIASLDFDSLLQKLTEKIRQAFSVDVCDVRIMEGAAWRSLGASGLEAETLQEPTADLLHGGSRRVLEERRPLVIPDMNRERTQSGVVLSSPPGFRAYLGIPLFSRGGDAIGVLRALSTQPREFTQDEIDLLQQLANGMAIALENARLFAEVQKKSAELEQALKAQSDFLNTMAHELRTPLNVLLAAHQLFMDGAYGAVSETQKKGFATIERNAQSLLHLITNILDLARLGEKGVELRVEEFTLQEMIEELEASFMPLAHEKGLNLKFEVEDPSLKFQSDKAKIRAILQNLLGNAVKYTDQGQIELRVACKQDSKVGGLVSFSVRDTGIGIKEPDIRHIFEAFYMVEGLDRRKRPGSGLGLSIVKRLAELLGGGIQVKSEYGKGSVFTATLPRVLPIDPAL